MKLPRETSGIFSSRTLRRLAFLFTTAGCLQLGCASQARAQGAIPAIVLGMKAHDVIAQADQAAQGAIQSAERVGNGMIAHAGSELSVLATQADIILGGNVKDAVRDLDREQQNLVGLVYAKMQDIHQLQDTAWDIKDAAVVDLASLSEVSSFTKLPYFIQRIDGLSQVQSAADYHVTVRAYGIALGSESKTSQIRVTNTRSGRPISLKAISVRQNGVADLLFDNATLAPFFDSGHVSIIPIDITLTVDEKGGVMQLYGTRTTEVSAHVAMILYPPKAGEIVVTANYPVYGWVDKGEVPSPKFRIGDGQPTGEAHPFITVPGGSVNPHLHSQRLQGPQWHCDAWWSHRADVCGFQAWWRELESVSVTPDGTRASWGVKVQDFSESRDFWITAELFEYELTHNDIRVETTDLFWGKPIGIPLPDDYSGYKVHITMITKQQIDLIPSQSSKPFIEFVHVSNPPNPTAYYVVGMPNF